MFLKDAPIFCSFIDVVEDVHCVPVDFGRDSDMGHMISALILKSELRCLIQNFEETEG
jgi:hypothetical protein